MILLGVHTCDGITAVSASVKQASGNTEKDVLALVARGVFNATAQALNDARIIAAKELDIYTNDSDLLQFLTPPIRVQPTGKTKVQSWDKNGRRKNVDVPTGGDPDQWTILYRLFAYNRWRIQRVTNLANTEALHSESPTTSAQGCAKRLYPGFWASA